MGRETEQKFLQKTTSNQQVHEKELNMHLIIREMYVKTTMKYNFTNLRMAITKREKTSVEKDMECCGNVNYAVTMENSRNIPQKIKNRTYSLVIPLLGVYARKQNHYLKKIHTPPCSLKHYLQ